MPPVSIIVPSYNRAEQLRACLQALCHQTQPSTDYEVIVVVDGSTDGTLDILARLKTPYQLRVLHQPNSGQSAALNRGAAVASGDILIFIDDDLVAARTLVAGHFRLHLQRRTAVAIGQMSLTVPDNADWFARQFARDWNEHYRQLNQGTRQVDWEDCYGGNMSVAKALYMEVGGNDETLWRMKDMDLAYRLHRRGCEFVYVPEALGHLDERKGVRELTKDAERGGAAWVQLYERDPSTLPRFLGAFSDAHPRERVLRRILLALKIPPVLLALFGSAVRNIDWQQQWYRFLRGFCYWRGVRRALPDRQTWQRITCGTPILMYHAFGHPGERASRYVMPARRFKRQMALLKRLGYAVISLAEYIRLRSENRLPPRRSVVITIDDGYADNYQLASPILLRHGFSATVFLVTGTIGGTNNWARSDQLLGRPLLTWSQVHDMLKGPIEFGSHTRTHPILSRLPAERLHDELEGSRLDLERQLGMRIDLLAYPYGEYDSGVQACAEAAGFVASCTVQSGLNTPRTPVHALRRTEIYGTDSLFRFFLAIWLGDRRVISRLGKRPRSVVKAPISASSTYSEN